MASQLFLFSEKAKQQEDVNDEKLTFLHVKLHQEADKIRKWKNQTEFDLKQKVCNKLEIVSFVYWVGRYYGFKLLLSYLKQYDERFTLKFKIW